LSEETSRFCDAPAAFLQLVSRCDGHFLGVETGFMHERPRAESPSRDASVPVVERHPEATALQPAAEGSPVVLPERQRILVLKLDHRGDFLIGLPALEKLRATFPGGHIVLVCGSWNQETARAVGIADEIRTYDYFPENSHNWNGEAVEEITRFQQACHGRFDIAIDLRVDEDTRPLLRHVDAALRCGIGSRARHPFLDVVLPAEFEWRERRPADSETLFLDPAAFHSRMPVRNAFFHETDFSVTDAHLIFGPYAQLPVGRLRAEFGFQLLARMLRPTKIELVFEVSCGPDVIVFERLRQVSESDIKIVALEFDNDDPGARYEFRVYVGGRPRRARLRFYGVRIGVMQAKAQSARLLQAELHIGEQLSLLVQLIADRVRPLYAPNLVDHMAGQGDAGILAAAGIPETASCVVIASFSNSPVRDWPLDRYSRLIGLLMAETSCHIVLVGARDQARGLSHLCQQHDNSDRIFNLGGRTDWSVLAAVLRRAELVIANNSGVAHLAAACARPTLAIYSGSHQPREWGPRGDNVRAVTTALPCSPCGYERLELCPHDHLCMTMIEPETVFRHATEMLPACALSGVPPKQALPS